MPADNNIQREVLKVDNVNHKIMNSIDVYKNRLDSQ